MKTKKQEPVEVEIKEFDKEIEIKITPLKRDKEINIKYIEEEGRSEFVLTDTQLKGIELNREYAVRSSFDGDTDWETETFYPCEACETKRNLLNKKAERIEYLEKLIKKIADGS